MNIFKKTSTFLMILSLLVVMSACAKKTDSRNHPPLFQELTSQLALPRKDLLAEFDLTEAQLKKTLPGSYETPLTVMYHDIPFTVSLLSDTTYGYLGGFRYSADFGTDVKAFSEAVYRISKAMTDALGQPKGSSADPDQNPLADITAAELEAKISAFDPNNPASRWTNTDAWGLEALNSKNVQSYVSLLQENSDAQRFQEKPVLLMELSIHKTLQDTYEITITYGITFGWVLD